MSSRRDFLRNSLVAAAAGAAGSETALGSEGEGPKSPRRRPSGSQRRWRTAFGLNGFMSSIQQFGNSFHIWEVLDFARKEGFEAIELVDGWPAPYPDPEDDARIDSLRSLLSRYNLKAFSIQTGAGGAFAPDPAARKAWLKRFEGWARFARKMGAECIGLWPGGGLRGQTLEEARGRLIETLKEVAGIVAAEELLASVEIEPPFVFHTIEDMTAIVDGVDHPLVKAIYDPSHFDVMNGGKGKPEELLLRLGVERVGYIHLTDTDGTLFAGTSRHLPVGDGHVNFEKTFEILWDGGYEGWIMIDAWKIRDPYDACRKGRKAIEEARRRFTREGR